jgi:hypothetical protein
MKVRSKWLAGCLATFSLSLPAQYDPPKQDTARFGDPSATVRILEDYFYGVVQSVASDSIVLDKTKSGVAETVRLEKKTKFIRDGKEEPISALKVGEHVFVEGKANKKTGEISAKRILAGVIQVKRGPKT